jgi:glutamate 5-kinase
VNENDTVTNIYTEQAPVFRDNDRLAALVLSKLDAEALILLSNVDGLYESDGQQLNKNRIIPVVTEMTPALRGTARGGSTLGRGGMAAKLDAAEIAMHAGGLVVIANGNTPAILHKIFHHEPVGTLFLPKRRMAGKRRWLAFATTVRGHVTINANARKALLNGHASLLISGVTACGGDFSVGQVIAIQDGEGAAIGRGIAECGSREVRSLLAGDAPLKGILVRRENFLVLHALEHANVHA